MFGVGNHCVDEVTLFNRDGAKRVDDQASPIPRRTLNRPPPLLAGQGGFELVGAIAWQGKVGHRTGQIEIEKVMVSPTAVHRGIASALLGRVVETRGDREIAVATGRDNIPAVSLYAKHGFRAEADEQVPPGIWITRFRLPA